MTIQILTDATLPKGLTFTTGKKRGGANNSKYPLNEETFAVGAMFAIYDVMNEDGTTKRRASQAASSAISNYKRQCALRLTNGEKRPTDGREFEYVAFEHEGKCGVMVRRVK